MRGVSTRLKRLEQKQEEEFCKRIDPFLDLVLARIPDEEIDLFLAWLESTIGRPDLDCSPEVEAIIDKMEALPGAKVLLKQAFE